jgi:hypothetical protein
MKIKLRLVMLGVAVLLCAGSIFFLIYLSITVYTDIKALEARVAESCDYTKRTTPLSQKVINDVCLKFVLNPNDRRCQPGAVVYGPDFFPDIEKFFKELPKQEIIVPIVDEKLGAYLVNCEKVTKTGDYRCKYDLKGDGRYSIAIYFTVDGMFERMLDPVCGS